MASVSEKKYVYDGMYVIIKEKKGCVAVVQPVDKEGRDYGEAFPVQMGDLKEVGDFIKE
ncbi:hypothetical protein II582_01280 [bacterium]|nr:hypothetical protein [bacterium]